MITILYEQYLNEELEKWTATRIISARAADEEEVKMYFDWKYGEQ